MACVVLLASSSATFLTGQGDGHWVMSRSGILMLGDLLDVKMADISSHQLLSEEIAAESPEF